MARRFLVYRTLAAFTCQAPVFALFYLSKGLDYRAILMLALAFAGAKVACDVPSGIFADRFGRKAAILARVGLEALSVGVLFGDQFLLSSLLGGAAVAFSSGAEQALVFEWHGRSYTRAFGRLASWSCLSTAAAALAGGALATVDFKLVYALRLGILIAAGVVALPLPEPSRAASLGAATPAAPLDRLRLARLLAFVGALGAVHVAALQLQQPYLREAGVPLAAFGAMFVAFQLATALGSRLAHRVPSPLAAVAAASAAGFAFMALPIPAAGVAAVFLLKLAHGVSLPAFGAALNALAPPSARATTLSLRSLFEGSALLLAAPLLGRVADSTSLQAAFGVAAVLVLPSFLFLEPAPCAAHAGSSSPE